MRKRVWLCATMGLCLILLGTGIFPQLAQLITKGAEVATMKQQTQSDFIYEEGIVNYDKTDVRYRAQIDLNWKFIQDDTIDASAKDFDDSSWRLLNLPHDWSIEGEYSQANPCGGSGGFLPTGIGWYRKTLTVPAEWRDGRQVFLTFDGVFTNSTVYVDGEKVGGLEYGWLTFSCDITQQVQGKESIVVAVKVDNSVQPGARWYTGSGIYSHVWLTSTKNVHIAENGTYVTTPAEFKQVPNGDVNLETLVKNDGAADVDVSVRSTIYNKADGTQAAQVVSPAVTVVAGGDFTVTQTAHVDNPALWNTETPNLYYVETEILVGDTVVDDYITNFGFRSVSYDVNGMYLNGENIELKGVANHWALGSMGAAQTTNIIRYKIQMMKDMGVNCIRTAHNACPPEFYDLCDEMGMMVMDEFSEGERGKTAGDYGTRWFQTYWKRDIESWVRRDRNHPSIVVWSIGNETGSDNDNTGISAHIKNFDTTRPTTGSAIHYGVDIPGANGQSEPESFAQPVETLPLIATEAPHTHAVRGVYRTQTWRRGSYSEYGAGGYVPHLTATEIFRYDWSSNATPARVLPSDYDNAFSQTNVRNHWVRTRDNDWRIGEFRWTGFDYLGEANYVVGGWPYRMFHSGAVDTALFEKSMYYLYQSMWTEEPMIHILPSWTHPTMEEGTVIPVWVYSNCETVELYLNGELFETETRGPINKRGNLEIQFDFDVPYTPGTITAKGYDAKGNLIIEDTYTTASAPAGIQLENTVGEEMPVDSSYIGQVTVSTVDKDGNFYPYGENRSYYYVSGPAYIKAADNGSPVDVESHVNYNRKNFMGLSKVFVGATQDAGDILFTAASIVGEKQQLTSDFVSIDVQQLALRGNPEKQTFEIYYTTDGTTPDKSSYIYTEAFAVEFGTTVKAAVYVEGTETPIFVMEEKFAEGEGLFWKGSNTAVAEKNVYPAIDAVISEGLSKVEAGMSDYYVDFGGHYGTVEYTVTAEKAGDYYIAVNYNNGSGTIGSASKTLDVLVNGTSIGTQKFVANGPWTTFWSYYVLSVKLNKGENTITFDSGTGVGPNLRELRVFSAEDTYVAREANLLTGDDIIGSYASGFDGQGVDVGGNGGSVSWTITDKPAGVYKLTFFYSTPNGSLREVKAAVNDTVYGYFPGKKVSPNYGATWGFETIDVRLAPGKNTVSIVIPTGGTLLGAVVLEEISLDIATPSILDASCVEDARLAGGNAPALLGNDVVSANATWDIVTNSLGDYYLVNRQTGKLLVSNGLTVSLADGENDDDAKWRREGEALNYDYLVHVRSGKMLAVSEDGTLIVDDHKNYDDSNMRTNRAYWRISELGTVEFNFAADTPVSKLTSAAPFTVVAQGDNVTYSVLSGPATVDAQSGLVTLTGKTGTVVLKATGTVDGKAASAVHFISVHPFGIASSAPDVYYAKDAVWSPIADGDYTAFKTVGDFVDFNNCYGSVDFTVTAPEAGEYYISVGYNTGNDRYFGLSVGETDYGTFAAKKNGSWHAIESFYVVKVSLAKGENLVKVYRPTDKTMVCVSQLMVSSASEWLTAKNSPTLTGNATALSRDFAFDGTVYNTGNNPGTVTWNITVPVDGTYKAMIPYASGNSSASISLLVDGETVATTGDRPTTGGYEVALKFVTTEEFTLKAGEEIPVTLSWSGGAYLTGVRFELVEGQKTTTTDATVNVTVNGTDATVELWDGAGRVDSALSENGTVTLTIPDLKEGIYTYSLRQVAQSDDGWIYDMSEKTLLVTVINGVATVTGDTVFTNVPVPVTADVILSATVNGALKTDLQLLLEGEVVETLTEANGVVNFTTLTLEDGTYVFTVKQVIGTAGGWTYDDAVHTITVTVTDGNAAIEGDAIFENIYKAAPGKGDVDLKVTLSDKTLVEGQFTFVLMKGEEELARTTNDAEGNISFKDIVFAEAGEIALTVYQVIGDEAGITYDDTVMNLIAYVEDWGEGELDVCGMDGAGQTFKNQYRVPFADDGVITEDGYFEVNGKPTEMGLFERDGAYYYAQYNGLIIKNQKYYVWKLSTNCGTMTEGWYAFDENGKVVENGMFTDSQGTTWYYENYAPKEKGLFKYGDNYYVAQYDGKIITSKSYEYNEVGGKYYVWLVDDTATDIGKGWRYFDENGLMLQGIQVHPEKGGKYYFLNGQPKEMGIFKYSDGNHYVAQYDGKIITSDSYEYDGVGGKYYVWLKHGTSEIEKGWRYFDENGLMLQGIQMHPEKNELYYFVNGQPKEMGLFKVGEDYYVAQYDGKIITSKNYYTGEVGGKYYVWKTTGCDHLKGWQFFDETGKLMLADAQKSAA